MRIAGNKVKHLLDFYLQELKQIHEPSEIKALFNLGCEQYLGWSGHEVVKNLETNLNQSDLLKLYDCGKALAEGQAIQYIFSEAWFYSRKFKVSPAVLIPRAETEELVDTIIKAEKKCSSIFDIGTGSGCIPIALALALPQAAVSACDISTDALAIAKENAKLLHATVNFMALDILSEDADMSIGKSFDVVVSNPPYILSSEKSQMSAHVINQEPHLALFVEGLDEILFYRKIISLCKTILNKKGVLYFELNPLTAEQVKLVAEESSTFSSVELFKDISGKLRFLRAVKK